MSDMPDQRGGFGGTQGQTPYKGSVGEQASSLVRDLKEQTSTVLDQATGQIKDQVSEAVDVAKDLASEAGDKLRGALEEQKTAGADFVGGVAGAIRRAANEFDHEIPQAAHYIRRAAEQVENVSDALRRRDIAELVGGVRDFARRQPTAFLGATVLVGFAAVRFLKSSTGPRPAMAGSGGMSGFRSPPAMGAYGSTGANRSSDFRPSTGDAGYAGRAGSGSTGGFRPASGGMGPSSNGAPGEVGSRPSSGPPSPAPGSASSKSAGF
jgi:gas vesicle protein